MSYIGLCLFKVKSINAFMEHEDLSYSRIIVSIERYG